MTEQHKKAIEELVSIHGDNPNNVAMIICGSLATGKSRVDSDVDLYLVVKEEEFERISRDKDFFYGSWDPERFSGVEVDGKIISKQFLKDAVIRGNEPTRASFERAYTVFCSDPEIPELIKKIPVYPVHEQMERIRAFYAFVKHYRYVGEDAFRQRNHFLWSGCLHNLIFFAARLVLAHNKVLFPCHKSLFKAVDKCTDMPVDFSALSTDLLEGGSLENMIAYYDMVMDFFKAYDYPDRERIGLILENEWTWFTGKLTVSEW